MIKISTKLFFLYLFMYYLAFIKLKLAENFLLKKIMHISLTKYFILLTETKN